MAVDMFPPCEGGTSARVRPVCLRRLNSSFPNQTLCLHSVVSYVFASLEVCNLQLTCPDFHLERFSCAGPR
jgi:hypothetical protein